MFSCWKVFLFCRKTLCRPLEFLSRRSGVFLEVMLPMWKLLPPMEVEKKMCQVMQRRHCIQQKYAEQWTSRKVAGTLSSEHIRPHLTVNSFLRAEARGSQKSSTYPGGSIWGRRKSPSHRNGSPDVMQRRMWRVTLSTACRVTVMHTCRKRSRRRSWVLAATLSSACHWSETRTEGGCSLQLDDVFTKSVLITL